jgi:hypothetical protein
MAAERPARRDDRRREDAPRDVRREDAPRDARRDDTPRDFRRDDTPRDFRRDDAPRDFRRERFRRDDDLGPAVIGFGDEVPAFMLLRVRAPATETRETEA